MGTLFFIVKYVLGVVAKLALPLFSYFSGKKTARGEQAEATVDAVKRKNKRKHKLLTDKHYADELRAKFTRK